MAKRTFGEVAAEAEEAAPTRTRTEDVPAPVGTHTATVVARRVSPTSAGDKWRLSLKFKVDTGEHADKTSWGSHSYDPTNPVNVRILLSWCKALGFDGKKEMAGLDPDDGEAIMTFVHDRAENARVQIKVQPGRDGRPEVKYVDPLPANAPEPRAAATAGAMAKIASAPKPKTPAAKPTTPAAPKRPAI